MKYRPFQQMRDRIDNDKNDSDIAYFFSLLYYGEFALKLIVAGLCAAIEDDKDRQRYRISYKLVRASGLGDWAESLDDILSGPAAQILDPAARDARMQMTAKTRAGDWQYDCTQYLYNVRQQLSLVTATPLPHTIQLRQWFRDFANLRNKSRGHGAPTSKTIGCCCIDLRSSIDLLVENFNLFSKPWAHLRRNLSGKFRISPFSDDDAPFAHLRSSSEFDYSDGIYIALSHPRNVELIFTDSDLSDFFVANGHLRNNYFDAISPITGATEQIDATSFLTPVESLPLSETTAHPSLDIVGQCFSNMPSPLQSYVDRPSLEDELTSALIHNRHEIITLSGPGGIGKTSLALTVLHTMAKVDTPKFANILWFSARDIDLEMRGPKQVRPDIFSLDDIAAQFTSLIAPESNSNSKPTDSLANALQSSDLGATLFVLDNFETVASPSDIYRWLDSYIRFPNKVLITTRIRDFKGDYPVDVRGMTDTECKVLIGRVSRELGVNDLLDTRYIERLIEESDGHPYVIRVLLAEVARDRRLYDVKRLVASRDEILIALFERTFESLSPAAARVFLTLSSWRTTIPTSALEAVLLRPTNERCDVPAAIEELMRYSLCEAADGEDGEHLLTVPLAASLFGKKKLLASPWKAAIENDLAILLSLGASKSSHAAKSRIERLIREIAKGLQSGTQRQEELLPVLEFLSRRYTQGWLILADLFEEEGPIHNLEQAKGYLRRFLEENTTSPERSLVWRRMAFLCKETKDSNGELNALAEMCSVSKIPAFALGNGARAINSLLDGPGWRDIDVDVKKSLVGKVTSIMENRLDELDATACSSMAWLYMRVKNQSRALELAKIGIDLDLTNTHCLRLVNKLS